MLLPVVFADTAAYFIGLLEHGNTGAALRESGSRRETADAATNNDDMWRLQCFSTREDQCELHPHASETETLTRTHSCAAAFALQL